MWLFIWTSLRWVSGIGGVLKDFVFCVRKQKGSPVDPAVFSCISMLAMATGPTKEMGKNILELLENMFIVGLR